MVSEFPFGSQTRELLMADLSGDPPSALEQAETKAG